MIPVVISCEPQQEGRGLVATTLEYIENDVFQRTFTFNPDGTYTPSEPVLAVNQEKAKTKLHTELGFPSPLTKLLGVKDCLSEAEYSQAFGYLDTNGTIKKSHHTFDGIVEKGRKVRNTRQALNEIASTHWPEG